MSDNCMVYRLACADHGFIHGAEAEELREGVEKVIAHLGRTAEDDADIDDARRRLQALLDKVDARDSLAFKEAQERDEDVPPEGWVDPDAYRRALDEARAEGYMSGLGDALRVASGADLSPLLTDGWDGVRAGNAAIRIVVKGITDIATKARTAAANLGQGGKGGGTL